MRTIFNHFLDRLRTSFWLVPGLFVFIAGYLTFLLLEIDDRWGVRIVAQLPWLYDVSAEGTRSLLSTAATSVLTLAGVTFSATLVALTLASSQFGPRLLRNFIAAKSNQVSLGIMLGNFVICLLVLRAVRGGDEDGFVPHLATLFAFVATLGSLLTFILFIHSLANSLRADNIAASLHRDLSEGLVRYFPEGQASEDDEEGAEKDSGDWVATDGEKTITATEGEYLLAINLSSLIELAREKDLTCRVIFRPGHFVSVDEPILALPGDCSLDEGEEARFRQCLLFGSKRTPEQDFEFALRQLVEVALRALSPGINDPFTAMNCIDFLGAAVREAAGRRLPKRHYTDDEDQIRVVVRPTTFEALLGSAFHQLRQASVGKPDVSIRLLEALSRIVARCATQARRDAVLRHAETVAGGALAHCEAEMDRKCIESALGTVRRHA